MATTPTPHLDPDLLSAYLDDQVSSTERAQVDTHLAGCAACRSDLEGLRRMVSLFQALPTVPPPRTFYVTEAMVEPARAAPRWSLAGWRQWLGGLATVAALLLCMVVVQMQGQSGANSPVAVQQESTAAESAPSTERASEPEIATGQEDTSGAAESGVAEQAGEETPVTTLAAAPTQAAEGAAGGAALGTTTTEVEPPTMPMPAGEAPEDGAGEDMGTMADSAVVSPTLTLPPSPLATTVDSVTMEQVTPLAEGDAPPVATPVPAPTLLSPEALPFVALALLLLGAGGLILWRTRGSRA